MFRSGSQSKEEISILGTVFKFLIVVYTISAFVPLLKSDVWWIRVFDFPRLQLLIVGVVIGVAYIFFFQDEKALKIGYIFFLIIAIGFDLYRILPYTTLWPKE